MMKLIMVVAALGLSAKTYAQLDSLHRQPVPMEVPVVDQIDMTKVDGCMMKEGKMVAIKDGTSTPMKKEMLMANGTKVTTDGMCMRKDGKKIKLKEGDHVDMAGTMHSADSKVMIDDPQ